MRRSAFAAFIAAFCFSCASAVIAPSKDHPVNVCRITCASGRWLSRTQHLCVGNTFFEDGRATGRVTSRNVDGTVNTDVYTTENGDFPVEDTPTGTCRAVIALRCSASNNCSSHPGEVDYRNPE